MVILFIHYPGVFSGERPEVDRVTTIAAGSRSPGDVFIT